MLKIHVPETSSFVLKFGKHPNILWGRFFIVALWQYTSAYTRLDTKISYYSNSFVTEFVVFSILVYMYVYCHHHQMHVRIYPSECVYVCLCENMDSGTNTEFKMKILNAVWFLAIHKAKVGLE